MEFAICFIFFITSLAVHVRNCLRSRNYINGIIYISYQLGKHRSIILWVFLKVRYHLICNETCPILRGKCINTEFFLVRIQENTDQEKLRIWTLFTQCMNTEYLEKFYLAQSIACFANACFIENSKLKSWNENLFLVLISKRFWQ